MCTECKQTTENPTKRLRKLAAWVVASFIVYCGWLISPSTTQSLSTVDGHIAKTDLISFDPSSNSDTLIMPEAVQAAKDRAGLLWASWAVVRAATIVVFAYMAFFDWKHNSGQSHAPATHTQDAEEFERLALCLGLLVIVGIEFGITLRVADGFPVF